MRFAVLFSLLQLAGCYVHGWPFDDKRMCGAAYPQSKAECEANAQSGYHVLVIAEVLAVLPSLESVPSPHADVRFTSLEDTQVHIVRQYELRHGAVTKRIETSFLIPAGGTVVRRVNLGVEFSDVTEPAQLTVQELP